LDQRASTRRAFTERRYLSEESMAKIGEPVTAIEEAPLAITA
jgi:hypothetical protein